MRVAMRRKPTHADQVTGGALRAAGIVVFVGMAAILLCWLGWLVLTA